MPTAVPVWSVLVIIRRVHLVAMCFKDARSVIHRTSNQSGKRKYGSMINIISTKRFIFCSASRLVAYQVRISTANTGRTYCFMCIYHDFIIGCFLYRIEIMVVHPLSVMVFSTRDDVAHITTLYRVITIIGHKLVSFVHVSFVVTYRSRSFMMHH